MRNIFVFTLVILFVGACGSEQISEKVFEDSKLVFSDHKGKEYTSYMVAFKMPLTRS